MKIATLVFLIKNDNILLAMKKRGFGEGRYNGIGGKVEPGETTEQAIIRETQEEIGVKLLKFEKMANIIYDEFFKSKPEIVQVNVFIATKWSGKPIESEEMSPKWFKINNLPYDQMWSNDSLWIPKVIKGEKITAKFKLDEQDKIISHSIKPSVIV